MNNKDELSSHGIKPNCCILNTRRTIGTYGKKRVKIKKRSSIEIRNQDRALSLNILGQSAFFKVGPLK